MPQLRDYQLEDVTYLLTKDAMGLFNEQRTGKTPTALTVMQARDIEHLLIVCPATLLYNWYNECKRWLGISNICVIESAKKFRENPVHGAAVYLINYENLRETKKQESLVDVLLKEKITGLIVDEAHRCKSRKSSNFQAIERLSYRVQYRLYLTGTPAHNKPWEVWAILHFIDPHYYRSYWKFIDKFFQTKSIPTAGRFVNVPTVFKPGMDTVLQSELDLVACNRKRKDIMKWLPNEQEPVTIKLPLTKQQDKYITELEEVFETEHIETQGVLDRIIRIRQICTDPGILQLRGKSPKTEWIKKYLKDYPEHQIILFSNSRLYLCRLQEILLEKGYTVERITGDVSLKDRMTAVQNFQNSETQVLCIQTQAGKEGLTLDNADVAIFVDTFPPAADYQQARDRIVATTPEKVKPKEIIHLMMEGTYDEALYETVANNIEFTDIVNDYKNYIKRRKTHGK